MDPTPAELMAQSKRYEVVEHESWAAFQAVTANPKQSGSASLDVDVTGFNVTVSMSRSDEPEADKWC